MIYLLVNSFSFELQFIALQTAEIKAFVKIEDDQHGSKMGSKNRFWGY